MEPASPPPRLILGVAGSAANDQERASIRQAVFLLRYRSRILAALAAGDSGLGAAGLVPNLPVDPVV